MLGGADGGGCTKESELIDSNAGFYHLFEVNRPLKFGVCEKCTDIRRDSVLAGGSNTASSYMSAK